MERKKKIVFALLQLVVVGVFIIMASASSGEDATNFTYGVSQGLDCQNKGYSFIGYYSSISACSDACEAKGYDYYCGGNNTTWCGCK